MQDFQKQLVYSTDNQLAHPVQRVGGIDIVIPTERKFASLESVQAYADAITGGEVKVVRAHGNRKVALGNGYRMEITIQDRRSPQEKADNKTPWQLREHVILHELAHCYSRDHHGPEFVAKMIEFVMFAMGPEAGLIYRVMMHQAGVKEGSLV
jgi:putative metallohydrolase (TIGR04338 family)